MIKTHLATSLTMHAVKPNKRRLPFMFLIYAADLVGRTLGGE